MNIVVPACRRAELGVVNVNHIAYSWAGGWGWAWCWRGRRLWGCWGQFLVGVAGELSESDKGGVTGIGISGGDKGDECLGNEEMSSSVLSSGSKDKARPIVTFRLDFA